MGWRNACDAHGTRGRNVSRERDENDGTMNKEKWYGKIVKVRSKTTKGT